MSRESLIMRVSVVCMLFLIVSVVSIQAMNSDAGNRLAILVVAGYDQPSPGSSSSQRGMGSDMSSPQMRSDTSRGAGEQQIDIVSWAMKHDDASTFVRLLRAANLTDTLRGKGPFTVFVPTNSAFQNMSGGMTVDDLLKPENKQQLTEILRNHIIQGRHTLDHISQMTTLSPLSGQTIRVTKSGGQVMLDNTARITQSDIEASNGVIQVVDHVLAPAGSTTERGAMEKSKSPSDIQTRGLDQPKDASGSQSDNDPESRSF